MISNSSGEDTVIMETTSRDLRKKLQLVRNHIGDFLEDDVDMIRVSTVERDLKDIQEERDEFRSSVEDFLEDYSDQLDTAAQNTWKDSVAAINQEVKVHAKKIRAKVHQICPPIRPLSMFEKTQISIQMRQLALMEAKASKNHDASTYHSSAEKTRVLALAKKKFDAFFEDSGTLSDMASKYPADTLTDLEKCKDQDVSSLMRDVSGWRRSLRDLCKDFNTFQELTIVHRLSEDLMDKIELEMESTKNSMNDLIAFVEKEDKDRNIRTLDHSKAEQRKFKKFSGALGEDFLYFKKDFEEAVIANRISISNQLEKMRENLTGEALKQVPKNMTGGLEAAW